MVTSVKNLFVCLSPLRRLKKVASVSIHHDGHASCAVRGFCPRGRLSRLIFSALILLLLGSSFSTLPSPYRELTRPLLGYIDRLRRKGEENFMTVVLPEFVPARWWQQLLHNQSSLLLKGSLLFKKGVIVTGVPYHLER